jgi:hypothetical protein
MTINLELRPEEERALLERARVSGRDLASYVRQVLEQHLRTTNAGSRPAEAANGANPIPDDLIDHEFIAYCAREADDSVTLEEVLQATSKIEDSMTRVLIEEERAERF